MTTTTTEISRLKLTHPDFGYDGGTALHALLAALNTKLGNNVNTRYAEFTGIANNTTVEIDHNFGVSIGSIDYLIMTGTGSSKIAVTRQVTISDWQFESKIGSLNTVARVTTPATGGPHTFSVALAMRPTSSVVFNDTESPNSGEILIHGINNKVICTSDLQYVGQQLRVNQGTLALPGYSFINDTDTGVYSVTSNNLALVTQALERLSIGANGEISIKRNSSVTSEAGFSSNVPFAADTATATFGGVGLGRAKVLLASGTSETNTIDAQIRNASTNPGLAFAVRNDLDAAPSVGTAPLFQWNSGTTEVMRINRDGALIVRNGVANGNDIRHDFFGGNTSGLMRLVTSGTIGNGSGNRMQFCDGNTGGTPFRAEAGVYKNSGQAQSNGYIALMPSTSTALSFYWVEAGVLRTSTTSSAMGTGGGSAVGDQTSDERLKSNITSLDYGLEETLALRPIRFTFNGRETIGFGAQTTQAIIPEAVHNTGDSLDPSDPESPTDKLAMSYSLLIPCLAKAIQELSAKVDAQAVEIAELKSRL
jgi:hypothetical protein